MNIFFKVILTGGLVLLSLWLFAVIVEILIWCGRNRHEHPRASGTIVGVMLLLLIIVLAFFF